MKIMDIRIELEKLNKSVYTPMVFYLPHLLFQNITEDKRKKLVDASVINCLFVINIKGDVSSLLNSVSSLDIYQKDKILKQNFMQLLELEEQLQKETFSNLFKEYSNTVYCYEYIYNWMAKNVEKDFPEIDSNIKLLFKRQHQSLTNHLLEINHRFIFKMDSKPISLNFDSIVENSKKIIPIDADLRASFLRTNTSNKTSLNTTTVNRKKKNHLPTVNEVDDFLLKTVFGVDVTEND